ncbi:MAG: hypothetical protein AAF718_13385 [Pseudomonadota bacterium]
MDKTDDILFTLAPSIGRRLLGAGSLALLGVLLVTLVFEAQGVWSGFFLITAILILLAAHRLWHATGDCLELTRTELRTGRGRVLTEIGNVKSIDRGVFAFKPSNGFLVKLEEPNGTGWSPGLWWQRGRLIGVGGVVRGGEARAMAEFIMALKDGTFDELF